MKKLIFIALIFLYISCSNKNTKEKVKEQEYIPPEPILTPIKKPSEIAAERRRHLKELKEQEEKEQRDPLTLEDFSLMKGEIFVQLYSAVEDYNFFSSNNAITLYENQKMKNFDGLEIGWTCFDNQNKYIYYIETSSPKYSTKRNIQVGSTIEEVFDKYGKQDHNDEMIIFEMSSAQYECQLDLIFYIENNKVSKIHIEGAD